MSFLSFLFILAISDDPYEKILIKKMVIIADVEMIVAYPAAKGAT